MSFPFLTFLSHLVLLLENYAEGTDLRSMTSILGFGSQYKAVEQSGNRVRFCSACEV